MEAGSLLGFLYFGEEGEEEASIVQMNNLSWHVEVPQNPKTQLCYVKALQGQACFYFKVSLNN